MSYRDKVLQPLVVYFDRMFNRFRNLSPENFITIRGGIINNSLQINEALKILQTFAETTYSLKLTVSDLVVVVERIANNQETMSDEMLKLAHRIVELERHVDEL